MIARYVCLKMPGWLLALVLLTGCSAQAAQRPIAAYPAAPQPIAAATRRPPAAQFPLPARIVYHASLEMQAPDVEAAVAQAADLAGQYGGYLAGLNTWQTGAGRWTTVDLAVPTANFDALLLRLRRLGAVQKESLTGQPEALPPVLPPDPPYSTITIQFQPAPLARPVGVSGWDPARTFERAWGVFVSVFGFLADILIWVVVVIGPFALLAGLIYWLVRRARRARPAA